MSFLDEVDSFKAKLGIGVVNPFVFVGVCILALGVVFAIGVTLWGGFTSPGVVVEHQDTSESSELNEQAASTTLCVHVVGEVVNPGMYELGSGARVSDAVNAAGGMLESADQLSVNLAREVSDGEQIVVSARASSAEASGDGAASPSVCGFASNQNQTAATGKININTASASELTSLDGVGDATATKIIAYRQENGSFSAIEDIKKVSGIGDKKFEAIKDHITV